MTPISRSEPARSVLIFSASAGGGHLAAAGAVQQTLQQAGHRATIIDGLSLASSRLRWVQVDAYAWLLARFPWGYEVAFRILGLRPVVALNRYLIGRFWGKRLLGAVELAGADVVVSTFPTVTAGLGRLVKQGRLACPVIAIVTDFGVHPMWVSPEIELHLVPSEASRRQSERAGGRAAIMCYPIDDRFHKVVDAAEARDVLELSRSALICLIVGGAWGVGDLEDAAAQAVAAGAFPIVVTGSNERLRSRLERCFPDPAAARVLGWTDQMAMLMAASDCLIQNAGGVTCLEAIAVGLPVIFYRPIPGHGKLNASTMEASGAATFVRGPAELRNLLGLARHDRARIPQPDRAAGDDVMASILAARRPRALLPRTPARRPVRAVAFAAITLLCLWLSFSSPGLLLTARALGHPVVVNPPANGEVVVAIRVTDPVVAKAVELWMSRSRIPVTLFVDETAARGLDANGPATIGLALPGRRRNPVDAGRDWVEERRAAKEVEHATGIQPSYVLVDDGRVRLGPILTSPEDAALVVASPEATAGGNSGIVVVDTDGLAPGEAIARIDATVAVACSGPAICVGLPPRANDG
jgi:processive 1,2-diacylglycerol beta-glucosyltransferase